MVYYRDETGVRRIASSAVSRLAAKCLKAEKRKGGG